MCLHGAVNREVFAVGLVNVSLVRIDVRPGGKHKHRPHLPRLRFEFKGWRRASVQTISELRRRSEAILQSRFGPILPLHDCRGAERHGGPEVDQVRARRRALVKDGFGHGLRSTTRIACDARQKSTLAVAP
jgi:hypothetical protein